MAFQPQFYAGDWSGAGFEIKLGSDIESALKVTLDNTLGVFFCIVTMFLKGFLYIYLFYGFVIHTIYLYIKNRVLIIWVNFGVSF